MMTFRKPFLVNFLRRPLDWIHTLLAAAVTGRMFNFKKNKSNLAYFKNTQDKIQASLCGDGNGEIIIACSI